MQTNSYDPTLDEAHNKKHDPSVVALNPKVGGTCPKDGGLIVDGQCQECGMKHKQESYVSERTLTRGEEKEKEKNVKGMKKSFSDFKKRYGKDAKSVMYATATKMAKEETEIAEGKKKGLWDNIHAKRKRGEKPAKPGDKDYPETLNVEERNPEVEAKGKKVGEYERAGKYQGITSKFRKEHPGSRQPKKVPGAKETAGQAANRRNRRQAERAAKHGLTSKEKKETQARAPYYSSRD